jgi:hypothetical protein
VRGIDPDDDPNDEIIVEDSPSQESGTRGSYRMEPDDLGTKPKDTLDEMRPLYCSISKESATIVLMVHKEIPTSLVLLKLD